MTGEAGFALIRAFGIGPGSLSHPSCTLGQLWGLLIFDGDDTLWVVEPLYDEARALVRTYIESLEMDGARWEEFQRKIDIGNVQILGLSSTRFPTSCIQAYEHLAASPGLRHGRGVLSDGQSGWHQFRRRGSSVSAVHP
ncbi:MAG: hypothetical protein ACRD1T_06830 [Acidimicrobiia bacterium]